MVIKGKILKNAEINCVISIEKCTHISFFFFFSVRIKPGSTSPVEYQSESDAESGTESGSASFSTQGMEPR